jgi:3-phenylpropionate/cinnamic acid dioxygenase small subunit
MRNGGNRLAEQRDDGPSPVDDALYARLSADIEGARKDRGSADAALARDAELFLYREARLLDDRDYRAWIGLLASNFIYWVPSEADAADARAQSAVNFDDRRRILDRIALMETGALHAQIPPSRTCRIVSNVEAWSLPDGRIDIRSNLLVWEFRRGRTTRYVGRQEHRAVKHAGDWLMERKVIRLIDAEEPQGNVTFIL